MRHPSTCSAGRPSPANGIKTQSAREKQRSNRRYIGVSRLDHGDARPPKDNMELRRTELRFRQGRRKLEHIAGLMDELQREIEGVGPRLAELGRANDNRYGGDLARGQSRNACGGGQRIRIGAPPK